VDNTNTNGDNQKEEVTRAVKQLPLRAEAKQADEK